VNDRFARLRQENHLAFELSFFFAGFLFDVLLLHRIDSTPLLIHQGSYLLLSTGLIFWDHRIVVTGRGPTGFWGAVAEYRLWLMHFLLGTLLNAFLIFYFRSSSGALAFLFLLIIAAIIVANELPRFRKEGAILRVALLSFCITSLMAYVLPVVWGELRDWQYVVAVFLGAGATVGLWPLFRRWTPDPTWTARRAVLPGLCIQAVLLLLYVFDAIPPVPLSLQRIGIYTSVTPERSEGTVSYRLEYQPASVWRFWRDHDDDVVAPVGSKVWTFARIFAPARFRDQVQFAWEFADERRGWTSRGAPFSTAVTGGKETGFRTFAYSTLGPEGRYRVRVLTMDGREIGRTSFVYRAGESPPTEVEVD
jgi:hypothetical protein